jgi:dihydroneopterin aldolase
MTSDVIELRSLRLLMRVGVLPFEHEQAQPVEVDLDVEVPVGAGATDDLATSVDYGALTALVVATLQAGHVELLERAAHLVANAVLAVPLVQGVTVTVRKLRPPVPHDLASSAVRITRRA